MFMTLIDTLIFSPWSLNIYLPIKNFSRPLEWHASKKTTPSNFLLVHMVKVRKNQPTNQPNKNRNVKLKQIKKRVVEIMSNFLEKLKSQLMLIIPKVIGLCSVLQWSDSC